MRSSTTTYLVMRQALACKAVYFLVPRLLSRRSEWSYWHDTSGLLLSRMPSLNGVCPDPKTYVARNWWTCWRSSRFLVIFELVQPRWWQYPSITLAMVLGSPRLSGVIWDQTAVNFAKHHLFQWILWDYSRRNTFGSNDWNFSQRATERSR